MAKEMEPKRRETELFYLKWHPKFGNIGIFIQKTEDEHLLDELYDYLTKTTFIRAKRVSRSVSN